MKKYHNICFITIIGVGLLLIVSCNSCRKQKDLVQQEVIEPYVQVSPEFNADSAYRYVEKQVSFGPRVPNSDAHRACGDYLTAQLSLFGAEVTEQKADIRHYDGSILRMRNIIGSYQPEKAKRILLFAHWDTRPWADRETDPQKQKQPIPGADDGASGVGVLLEIARQLQQKPIAVGIDIIFFDLEDSGQPVFDTHIVPGEWWCLGSEYWAKNPHVPEYKASYGILLDMVGAPDASFMKEGYSVQYAANIVEKIWRTAVNLGYGQFFISRNNGYVTDDHLPVNKHHRAPAVDIINIKDNTSTGFPSHWHTHDDNMNIISRGTLKAVGQTVMEVIYSEKGD
jgi:hypothetical protein